MTTSVGPQCRVLTTNNTSRLSRGARSCSIVLALALALPACSAGSGSREATRGGLRSDKGFRGNANYGREQIGYKVAPLAVAEAMPAGDVTTMGAAMLVDATQTTAASPAPNNGAGQMTADSTFIDSEDGEVFEAAEDEPFDDDGGGDDDGSDDDVVDQPVASEVEPQDADGGSGDAGSDPMEAGASLVSSLMSEDAGVTSLFGDAGPMLCAIPEFDQIPEAERQPENPFRLTSEMAASTFSIDVDTGSYTLARAAINAGVLPRPETVRIEEFINYFHLHYQLPSNDVPFSIYAEVSPCPWQPQNQLLMVGVQGQEVPLKDQPPANLVFLLDVSGSMSDATKLPLLKKGFRMITKQLREIDTVSIVTYSTTVDLALDATSGADKATILAAIDGLQASGSTAGEAGVQLAYSIAQEYFIEGGNNRVILATDGDFNIGINEVDELSAFIAEKRETDVFLSVYGFGSPTGVFEDAVAEQLADNGNGAYFFIDSPEEARRAFIYSLTGSLLTVAKDVKLQLQFNEEQVRAYRLVGYENRVLSNAAFSDDSVDAGELGAGLSVTAFFELISVEADVLVPEAQPGTDPLAGKVSEGDDAELVAVTGSDLAEIRVRFKAPDADVSKLLSERVSIASAGRWEPSRKFGFASAVAEFAMQLRGSQYLGEHRDVELLEQIRRALRADEEGAVQELLDLAGAAYEL